MNSSKIQWTDSSMNFWRGCTKVSAGCKNCYAEKNVGVKMAGIKWGDGQPRVKSKSFETPIRWNNAPWICDQCGAAHAIPGSICMTPGCDCETKHRRRVFSLSLGDWLDPEVPIEWLAEMLDVVRRCPSLTWQLVTKRPELWSERLHQAMRVIHNETDHWISNWLDGYVPRNLWIIASAEDQATFDQRVPHLLKIPAHIHALSCEPLLGPIDFKQSLGEVEIQSLNGDTGACDYFGGIEWVIVGGESGKDARRCTVHWLANIAGQCANAKVRCFIKQFGGNLGDNDLSYCDRESGKSMHDPKGGDITEWPHDLRIRQFPE